MGSKYERVLLFMTGTLIVRSPRLVDMDVAAGHGAAVTCLASLPHLEGVLASGGRDGRLKLWDVSVASGAASITTAAVGSVKLASAASALHTWEVRGAPYGGVTFSCDDPQPLAVLINRRLLRCRDRAGAPRPQKEAPAAGS